VCGAVVVYNSSLILHRYYTRHIRTVHIIIHRLIHDTYIIIYLRIVIEVLAQLVDRVYNIYIYTYYIDTVFMPVTVITKIKR